MKKAFYFTSFLSRFSTFHTTYGQNSEIAMYGSHFNKELKEWTKTFKEFNLSSFAKREISSFKTFHFACLALAVIVVHLLFLTATQFGLRGWD